jgi:hypothetical protein
MFGGFMIPSRPACGWPIDPLSHAAACGRRTEIRITDENTVYSMR